MKRAKRILVGLKTLDSADALVDLACRLGARGASLLLVHVLELPGELAEPTVLNVDVPELDATAAKIIGKGKRVARRNKMKARALVLRARDAASTLLDLMKEEKIDLAVLGYRHRPALGEILLGATAQHLAWKAPCHIVLSIPPREKA
jgi:nucleotide-binding universal stress UspA family protein